MGIILDIILIAIAAACVIYGLKKGFFKAVMSFVTGIASLLLAYTFTPPLSRLIYENAVIDKVAGSLAKTFASIAEAGKDAAENVVYDLTLLIESAQFQHTVEQCGAESDKVESFIGEASGGYEAVEQVAYFVAEPVSRAVSELCAFIAIFVLSMVALRVLTALLGLIFKLPVLKELDKTLGLVFGIASALFFCFVFSMLAQSVVDILGKLYPGTFGGEIMESSLLVRLLAKYNIIGAITNALRA